MSKRPKILVAPLDWGLGHATRCMPVIDRLLAENAAVILAGSGPSLGLLRERYPELPVAELPGYEVTYGKGSMVLSMARQMPRITAVVRKEHKLLEELIHKFDLDACISDNRYGLWSKRIPSVFICHQLNVIPPAPWGMFRTLGYRFHKKLIENFSRCWVPDLPENGMAGSLSHPKDLPQNARYVGILSRFESPGTAEVNIMPQMPIDLLAVLSGPEPQRTLLEEKIISQVEATGRTLLLVQGKPGEGEKSEQGLVTVIPHLDTSSLSHILTKAKVVISRPGYTSLMDYATLGVGRMILVPTPGQTEQEYLAIHLSEKKVAISRSQDQFELTEALEAVIHTSGFDPLPVNTLLEREIRELISL